MYEPLKGFRDFYPAEMGPRRRVIETIETVVRGYGFQEIATPSLEQTQLYIEKSGPDIVDELYSFTDKGGREVSLTPELTPTVARMVAAREKEMTKPIKWFSTRPFWRYEEPQQGRFREFYQTNIDIFGADDPTADAEILACCADFLTELGLTADDFEFRISHRDILGTLVTWADPEIDRLEAIRAIDRTATESIEATADELVATGMRRETADEVATLLEEASADLTILSRATDSDPLQAAVDELEAVLAATEDYGVAEYCTLSLKTARGLDYYTGVVFECFDTQGAVSRAIFGGGRYDDLIESLGGPSMPAVGVAPGLATLLLLLERADILPEATNAVDYFVLQAGDTRPTAAKVARHLRGEGYVVEVDLAGRGFGSQLSYADSIAASKTIIVGERDLAEGMVTVKDMETGDQEQEPLEMYLPDG